jgi:hypothetical protein
MKFCIWQSCKNTEQDRIIWIPGKANKSSREKHVFLGAGTLPLETSSPQILDYESVFESVRFKASRIQIRIPDYYYRSVSVSDQQAKKLRKTLTGEFFFDFFSMYFITHYFICRLSDSTVSEVAGNEKR